MRLAVMGVVATLVLCGCARQQAGAPAAATSSAAHDNALGPAAGAAGVRIFIDPVTGEARAPTAEELAGANSTRRIQAAAAQVTVAPDVVVTPLPGGITEYSINGGVQVDETTCVQKDGRLGECSAAQKAALRAAPRPEGK